MVGLYPIYDPIKDYGDERYGLHLPGIRTAPRSDNTFDVKYDIPLAFYDCRLDDGVTAHQDWHTGCGQTHPEWWGKTFFKHFPDNGFVGDIFTVNGVACPVLHVKRRKYRFRMLDASIARQYEFKLMQGNVAAVPGQQGQYNFVDGRGLNTLGEQVMRFTQIASDGGLLPFPIIRDSIGVWPAKRREVIIDFTRYQDGSPTTKGEVIYLANIAQMLDGRKLTERLDKGFDANYCVPVLKFVIDGDPEEQDYSLLPALDKPLRKLAPLNLTGLPRRTFRFNKADVGGEFLWTINGQVFDPARNEANPKRDRPELWTFVNEGGGWTHPIHNHMEEHRIISRDGRPAQGGDVSREDVVSLEGGEEVTFYRNFRTFTGKYVAHCHNLAHEDHAMMFGWTIEP
jgi:FtsP/CotA-like multicopper oxidase with cupredoxin domain